MKVLLHKQHDPSLSTAIDICEKLDLPLSFLIDGIPDDAETLAFARRFSRLDTDQRNAVAQLISTMLKSKEDLAD